ncbi:tyrosine-type recombinase/integrase [Pseudaminobacter sp. NGMCC 1.201702]|uniref:tyrosine-type recombinase/integrase n=1 Tax=Pseudaminobacter sp. NGMCC 1.201702 TaxID=3391825 RepID=UPI0039EEC9FD
MAKKTSHALAGVEFFAPSGAASDEEELVTTRSGLTANLSGMVWSVPHPSRTLYLDWNDVPIPEGPVWDASQAYFRHLIRNFSQGEISGNWTALYFAWLTSSLQEAARKKDDVGVSFLDEMRDLLGKDQEYRLHYGRKWYLWCCDQGFDGFSSEVAFQLEERVLGGNSKGDAVRSADPEQGPLLDAEIVALNNALRASRQTEILSLQEQVALWLCVGLGSNSGPLALLREEDFRRIAETEIEGTIYELAVPRHKKGDAEPRTQFRERKLNPEIGGLVGQLIEENQLKYPDRHGDSDGRPLFRRRTARKDLPQRGPGSDYRYHHRASDFTNLVRSSVETLGVASPRTGLPLKVSVRRLRYTFATRLVREGASQRVVAQLLDHSDLQNVQVYFDTKSDIVEHLDAAMALQLGPLSQAFLGTLVRNEGDALRGDRRSSRIYHFDKNADRLDALGTCGSFSFCGLTAPIACYTCVRFQPWMEAPHDKALSALLAERRRRHDAGQDPNMVMLFDMTILAIADVITRIEMVRRGRFNAA